MQGNPIHPMCLIFLSSSFYSKPRYDNIQVNHEDGTKFYSRLLAVFEYLEQKLAFVQHTKLLHFSAIYGKQILQLKDSYNVILVDAVDQMVEFKLRRGTEDEFYLHTTVENY